LGECRRVLQEQRTTEQRLRSEGSGSGSGVGDPSVYTDYNGSGTEPGRGDPHEGTAFVLCLSSQLPLPLALSLLLGDKAWLHATQRTVKSGERGVGSACETRGDARHRGETAGVRGFDSDETRFMWFGLGAAKPLGTGAVHTCSQMRVLCRSRHYAPQAACRLRRM
jgi:hypothetical protein